MKVYSPVLVLFGAISESTAIDETFWFVGPKLVEVLSPAWISFKSFVNDEDVVATERDSTPVSWSLSTNCCSDNKFPSFSESDVEVESIPAADSIFLGLRDEGMSDWSIHGKRKLIQIAKWTHLFP